MVEEWIINRISTMNQRYAHKVSKDGKRLYALDTILPEGSMRHCEDLGNGWTVMYQAPDWTIDRPWYGRAETPSDFSEEEITSAMEFIQTG
jgi:hypothetical protein